MDADSPQSYAQVVSDLLLAFNEKDQTALQRLNGFFSTSFTFDDLGALIWGRVYAYRQRSSRGADRYLLPQEAQTLVAQVKGYASWEALTETGPTRPARVPAYEIDDEQHGIAPRRVMTDEEWDELLATVEEHRITHIDGGGQLTDASLARIADLGHVTSLHLAGCRWLTDEGLRHLGRMPQLERLTLSAHGRVTDGGLAVIAQLASLRTFSMNWQKGISDAGLKHLGACKSLEHVDVMGSESGDGLIEALAGKPALRVLKTGRLVTDAGLAKLQDIPQLVQPRAGSADLEKTGAQLLIDGPFTNGGFSSIAALHGVVDLDLFWHVTGLTSEAFADLARLPHLTTLGADSHLSDDEAMRHFAAIPRLHALRAQGSVATDAGFESLAQSRTLEQFWGRECPNFGDRAFIAFSRSPALRTLGVGCGKVSDAALARFPDFPALRELTPIGVRDEGFRHIGRCERLERLSCMYCRDTTDVATQHIAGLQLAYYYAGLTQITDASLESLGRMQTLERIEFYECQHITDGGLTALAALPRLREISIASSPKVTLAGTRVFPPHVRVRYWT